MADEIIKLIEYITGNPIVQSAFIVYVILGAVVAIMAIAIIIFTFRQILNHKKRWK